MSIKEKLSGLDMWKAICICKKVTFGESYETIDNELRTLCAEVYGMTLFYVSRRDVVSKLLAKVVQKCCTKKQLEKFVISLGQGESESSFYTTLENKFIDFIGSLDMAYCGSRE